MSKRDTKSILLNEGTRLFLERGYTATGIHDILAASSVPKGSFYHHFKNKQDFGVQVIDRYGDNTLAQLDQLLDEPTLSPVERVRRFFTGAFDEFNRQGCRHGCLMGNLGQELAELDERFRERVATHLDRWAERIAACLQEAIEAGELPPYSDPQLLSKLLIDGFQGAALRMKLERSPAALERFLTLYFERLLAA